jgi:hypothetical protein
MRTKIKQFEASKLQKSAQTGRFKKNATNEDEGNVV